MITVPRIFQNLFEEDYGRNLAQFRESQLARADIAESEEAYHIRIDVPGYDKDKIEIEVGKDNTIHISGKRCVEKEEKQKYLFKERQEAEFQRSFRLPKAVQHEAITAACQDGVLQIQVPKMKQETEKRKILVK